MRIIIIPPRTLTPPQPEKPSPPPPLRLQGHRHRQPSSSAAAAADRLAVPIQPRRDGDGVLARLPDGRGHLVIVDGQRVELRVREEVVFQQGAGERRVREARGHRDEGEERRRQPGHGGRVGEEDRARGTGRDDAARGCRWRKS